MNLQQIQLNVTIINLRCNYNICKKNAEQNCIVMFKIAKHIKSCIWMLLVAKRIFTNIFRRYGGVR